MKFFGKRPNHDGHLQIKAAKCREDIVVETGIPIPDEKPQRATAKSDEWDVFWKALPKHASFVVTESFAHTVRAAANKRGVVTRCLSVGPFKVRIWRV